MKQPNFLKQINVIKSWSKRGGIYVVAICLLFLVIGLLTTAKPAYRISSQTLQHWTSQIEGESFLYLYNMENKMFVEAYPQGQQRINISNLAFQMATSIKPEDPRSLLGREIPGFSRFDGQILVAGEGTDYTNMPIESSPPMEIFDKEEPIVSEHPVEEQVEEESESPTYLPSSKNDVVFIYHTHNRESFLPLLPEGTNRDLAMHSEANITLVGDRLAQSLEDYGIGAKVDKTDLIPILKENEMKYYQSYDASRPIVEEAIATNQNFKYFFDLHRDSQPKHITTKEINGKSYARIIFVIGEEYARNEKNHQFANTLHKAIEKKYPGLSRGVVTYGGPGRDGKYNQDLSENAIVIEFGGVENNLEELYRSADALAEVFSDYYWKAEKVNSTPGS